MGTWTAPKPRGLSAVQVPIFSYEEYIKSKVLFVKIIFNCQPLPEAAVGRSGLGFGAAFRRLLSQLPGEIEAP